MLSRLLRSWVGVALIVVLACIVGGGLWLFYRQPPAHSLAALRSDGVIAVGVRVGVAPFSFLDKDKRFSGFEPDIARALAKAMGVKPKFVAVDSTNALGYLKQGVVDMVLLPRGGPDEHDPAIRSIDPGYYASGLNVLALKDEAPKSWNDLKGEPVCGLQSAQATRQVVDELGGNFLPFADEKTALQALSAERCVAFISDEVALAAALHTSSNESHLVMPFDTIDVTPWTVAVRTDDKALGDFVHQKLVAYHKSGFLIQQAKTWNLPESPYLEVTHQNLAAREPAPAPAGTEGEAQPTAQ
jgi:polar amino acid transport system substrate-binding protein